jgi:hypothetical protein
MLLQVGPLPLKSKGREPVLLQIFLHVAGIDSLGFLGIEKPLDAEWIRNRRGAYGPILHDHRNARGSAGIFLLLYKRDIEPKTFLRPLEPQGQQQQDSDYHKCTAIRKLSQR